jgi:hypothetical protein
MPEFSNTDAQLTRCIQSRLLFELAQLPPSNGAFEAVHDYITVLLAEIMADLKTKHNLNNNQQKAK